MKVIDADALVKALRKVQKNLRGLDDAENRDYLAWWRAGLLRAIEAVKDQSEVTEDDVPARLLVKADLDFDPNVDECGHLPCWREYAAGYGIHDDTVRGHWSYYGLNTMNSVIFRSWTKKPTQKQMDETPWESKDPEPEAIEVCPYCMTENVYTGWDARKKGYIAACEGCGREHFLCDECMNAEDNPRRKCDWHETEYGHGCFRGWIEKESEDDAE